MKKIFFLFIFIFLILTGIGLTYFLNKKEIKTYTVSKKEIIQAVYSSGRIEAKNQVDIKSEVSGYVQKLYIKENQELKQGQVVAKIKNEILPVQINEIQKQIERTIQKLKQDSDFRKQFLDKIKIEELNLSTIQKVYERRKQLFENKQISEEDFEKVKNQLEIQKSKINLIKNQYQETIKDLENQLKILKDKKDQLIRNLEKYTVKSPINGTVLKVFVKKGDYLNSMTSKNRIASVGNLKNLETKLFVDEEYIPLVRKGQKVLISLDAFPDKNFEGKITEITQKSDPTTRTVEVIADVKYPFNLPSEITIEANIIVNKKESLVIPAYAVQNGIVKVLEGKKIVEKQIRTGIKNNGYIEVLEGLKEGDKVILP